MLTWENVLVIEMNYYIYNPNYGKTIKRALEQHDRTIKVCFGMGLETLYIVFGNGLDETHQYILHYGLQNITDYRYLQRRGGGEIRSLKEDAYFINGSSSIGSGIPDEIIPIVMDEFNKLRDQYLAEIQAENQRGS